jgi:hypothetical protein
MLEDEDEELAEEVSVPVLNDAIKNDNDNKNETTTPNLTILLQDNKTIVEVGKVEKRKMAVRKAKLNPLVSSGIVAKGKKKMVELDILAICY